MIKVIFWGTPQFAVPSLQRLIQEPEVSLLGVVTQPDRRRGRGNKLIPSPIKTLAGEHQLPIWQPQRVNKDKVALAQLQALEADAFVVVAYGQILSPKILAMPRLGAVNSHGSLLPQYRGAAPIQWALYDGQIQTGITTMLMDKGMDTGDILLTSSLEINPLWTAEDLATQLADQSAELLVDTLQHLNHQSLQPMPQDHANATYARLIEKTDYILDWSRSSIELHNQIRGFYPNCITYLRKQAVKISLTVPVAHAYVPFVPPALGTLIAEMLEMDVPRQQPGTVACLAKGWGPVVQAGEGLLLLMELQLAGRRRQSAWDVVNGIRLQVGERFQNG